MVSAGAGGGIVRHGIRLLAKCDELHRRVAGSFNFFSHCLAVTGIPIGRACWAAISRSDNLRCGSDEQLGADWFYADIRHRDSLAARIGIFQCAVFDSHDGGRAGGDVVFPVAANRSKNLRKFFVKLLANGQARFENGLASNQGVRQRRCAAQFDLHVGHDISAGAGDGDSLERKFRGQQPHGHSALELYVPRRPRGNFHRVRVGDVRPAVQSWPIEHGHAGTDILFSVRIRCRLLLRLLPARVRQKSRVHTPEPQSTARTAGNTKCVFTHCLLGNLRRRRPGHRHARLQKFAAHPRHQRQHPPQIRAVHGTKSAGWRRNFIGRQRRNQFQSADPHIAYADGAGAQRTRQGFSRRGHSIFKLGAVSSLPPQKVAAKMAAARRR